MGAPSHAVSGHVAAVHIGSFLRRGNPDPRMSLVGHFRPIRPVLPAGSAEPERVRRRRVLNGIFWVLRSRRRGVNRAEGRLHLRIAMFRVTVSLLPASSKLGQVGYGLPPFAAAKNEAR
jgi:hypothetical protein